MTAGASARGRNHRVSMWVSIPLQDNSGWPQTFEITVLEATGWRVWDKDRMERL